MGVEIRSAGERDVESVLALWRAAYPSRARRTDTAEAVEGLLARDPGALLVAAVDGAIVGTLIAAWDGWRGNAYRLAVHPDHRRRGIAAELVRRGEERLRALGARRVSALVAPDDPAARAVWERAGYARDAANARWAREL